MIGRRTFLGLAFAGMAGGAALGDENDPLRGRRVLDLEGDAGTAPPWCYRVLDAETGEDLRAAWPVTYASEATGVVRVRARGEGAAMGATHHEIRRAVRIVPWPEIAARIHRVEARHRAWQKFLHRVPTRQV